MNIIIIILLLLCTLLLGRAVYFLSYMAKMTDDLRRYQKDFFDTVRSNHEYDSSKLNEIGDDITTLRNESFKINKSIALADLRQIGIDISILKDK